MLILSTRSPEIITEALTLMVVGMIVVFSGLVAIALLITLANRLLRSRTPAAAPSSVSASHRSPAPARPVATPASQDTHLTPELIAVLAAAATAALGRPAVVVWARPYHRKSHQYWVQSGRQSLMTSHRVIRRSRRER